MNCLYIIIMNVFKTEGEIEAKWLTEAGYGYVVNNFIGKWSGLVLKIFLWTIRLEECFNWGNDFVLQNLLLTVLCVCKQLKFKYLDHFSVCSCCKFGWISLFYWCNHTSACMSATERFWSCKPKLKNIFVLLKILKKIACDCSGKLE